MTNSGFPLSFPLFWAVGYLMFLDAQNSDAGWPSMPQAFSSWWAIQVGA